MCRQQPHVHISPHTHTHMSAHAVQPRSLLAPFDDSCNHMWWKISFSLTQIFFPLTVTLPLLLLPPFFPSSLLSPSAPLFLLSHLILYALLHRSSFSTSLSPSPCTYLLPVVGSSLSPTPSFAPRISSLLHGLASSLSLFPFIYINEQKSSFHLPPDEQILLVEEERKSEEQNAEEHSFSYFIKSTVSGSGNII